MRQGESMTLKYSCERAGLIVVQEMVKSNIFDSSVNHAFSKTVCLVFVPPRPAHAKYQNSFGTPKYCLKVNKAYEVMMIS